MLSPLFCLMYLQDDLKNTFFAQYQIVQGNTAFCKVFLQEIPHLQTIYKREFDTSKLKRILQSLETGLFFCQIFVFII